MRDDSTEIRFKTLEEIPLQAEKNTIFIFPPKPVPLHSREERTNRNKPIIFPALQERIHASSMVILGSGGIGGHIDDSMARLLPKRIIIVDSGFFDVSNIHRQLAAVFETVGKSKALETARLIRAIAPDVELYVCTEGTNPSTVYELLKGVDVAIDAIEYHRLGARYEALEVAEELGIPVLNGNSVGFGTRLFLWKNKKDTKGNLCTRSFKEIWPFDREYAYRIENSIAATCCTKEEYDFCCHAINSLFLPDIPNYGSDSFNTKELFLDRLFTERIACIISTNPKKAAGFLANNIVIFFAEKLGQSNEWKHIPPLPEFPSYIYEDTALRILETRTLDCKTIYHELAARMPR
jgi:molybdopterin/thiamine biosynthesis adenylyltransferase